MDLVGVGRRYAKSVRGVARQKKRLRRVAQDTPRKLHLGCGEVYIPDFCNVDIDPDTAADLIDNVLTLRKFPDEFADLIYACHVLEHVSHEEAPKVLATWRRVLKPGGQLYISVPDLDRVVTIYRDNWEHFHTRPNTPWIGLIYGGQSDPFDFHKTGFNFTWMTELLEREGFISVAEYPHEPHPFGVADASLAHEPFPDFLSLNVRAVRAS